MPTIYYDNQNILQAGNVQSTVTSTTSAVITNTLSAVASVQTPIIYDQNSNNVSNKWNTAFTFANTYSAYLVGDESSVASTSANWNSAFTFSNTNSALILGDLTNIATNSASWGGSGQSAYNSVSALILGDLTNIASTSSNWNSSFTFANTYSGYLIGDESSIAATSATWNTAYSFLLANSASQTAEGTLTNNNSAYWNNAYSALTATSGNWNQAYSYFTWLTANSGTGGGGGQSAYNTVSALILGDLTNIATTSANWNLAYTNFTWLSANSGTGGGGGNAAVNTLVNNNSAIWNASWTFSETNSALLLGDITNLATTSASWNQSYSYFTWLTANSGNATGSSAYQSNSALILGDLTNLATTSASWNQSYSYFTWLTANSSSNVGSSAYQSNSALILGDLTNLATTSAIWNSDHSTLTATSANWNSAYTFANSYSAYLIGDESSVAATSANWNTAYSFSNSNSALILGDLTNIAVTSGSFATQAYVASNFLALSGGVVQNTATFNNLIVQGTLSALSAAYFATTLVTSYSSLSVVDVGAGPALYVAELAASGPVATFNDVNGPVLYVGNRNGNTNNGTVGVNTNTPYKDFTVVGDISATGTIWSSAGNSNNWNAAFTFANANTATVLGNLTNIENTSGNWNAGYTFANSYSAYLIGDESSVAATSATWNTAYSYVINNSAQLTNVESTSGNWNAAYSTVNANSASWNPGIAGAGGALFAANSAMIFGDLTNINTTSANWNTSYSYFTWLTANSGTGGQSAYNSVSALILGDLTNIASTSATWNTSYNYLTSTSAQIVLSSALGNFSFVGNTLSSKNDTSGQIILSAGGAFVFQNGTLVFPDSSVQVTAYTTSFLSAASSYWQSGYTFANTYSAYLVGDESSVAATSANWNQAYSYFTWLTANSGSATGSSAYQSNSALILGDLTNIASTSAKWNTAYSYTSSNSALFVLSGSNAYLNSVTASNATFINNVDFGDANAFILRDNNLDLLIQGPYQISLKPNGVSQWTFGNDGGLAAPDGMTFAGANGGVQFVDGSIQKTAYPAATITALSGNWNASYSALTATSGQWNAGYTFANSYSGYLIGDETSVANTSANWNAAYSTVNANSASWNPGVAGAGGALFAANSAYFFGDVSNLATTSANWNTAYSFAIGSSAQLANVEATSANWNVTYSNVTGNSANWNNTYTAFSVNSASYATQNYVNSNFLPLSGGKVSGNTTFNNVTIQGTLSALSAVYLGTTITTSYSSLSVVDIGGGPALYVLEQGATGDVASFNDIYGEVLHIGNRQGGPYNGLVGINNGAPNKSLTVVGDISATATIYASAIEVGTALPNSVLPYIVGQFTSNVNSYHQVNIQNIFAGASASSDFVATADNGNDTSNYVDLGINNSAFFEPSFSVAGSNDSYLYSNGGAMVIGTATTNPLKFFVNGTLSSNVAMYIATGGNVGVGPNVNNPGATLTVNGTLSTNNVINDATGTSTQWNAGYTFANSYSGYLIGDESSVAATSANWNASYSTVNANSAYWNPGVGTNGGTLFAQTSAYIFGDLTNIATTSASWGVAPSALYSGNYKAYLDTKGSLYLPTVSATGTTSITTETSKIRGAVQTIGTNATAVSAVNSTPTVIWRASSNTIEGFKMVLRVQHNTGAGYPTELMEINAIREYDGSNVSFTVTDRITTRAITGTTISVDNDGSNILYVTATPNAGYNAYYTYSVTEFDLT